MHFDERNGSNGIFGILNTSQFMHQSPFHVSYVACCKDFVYFQIELFIETDSFELTFIDCDWTRV